MQFVAEVQIRCCADQELRFSSIDRRTIGFRTISISLVGDDLSWMLHVATIPSEYLVHPLSRIIVDLFIKGIAALDEIAPMKTD